MVSRSMMEVFDPENGTTVTSGPYFTKEIEFWVSRVKVEHQVTLLERTIRDLTKEESELENSPHSMGGSVD